MFNYPGYAKEDDNAFLKAVGNISIGFDFALDALANDYGPYEDPETGIQHNMMFLGYGSGFSDKDSVFELEGEIRENFQKIRNGEYVPQTPKESDDISLFGEEDGGAFTLDLKVGVIMDSVMETEGERKGQYKFGEFYIIGNAAVSMKREWQAAIGPVELEFSLELSSGDVADGSASGVRWRFFNDSDNDYYLNSNSTLNLLGADGISSQGDLAMNMAVEGGVAASVGGVAGVEGKLKVGVDHHSVYETGKEWVNTGEITLTPKVSIEVLGFTIPVWSQEWSWKYGNENAGFKTLSQRMQTVASDEILFTPTAMKEINSFADAQDAVWDSYVKAAGADGKVDEGVLKASVAEQAAISMQDLGNGKYLAVFLDAVPGRDVSNVLGAYYTVFDGKAWSAPALLDDDGTVDQLPTISNAGSKGWLIAWSNASKTFADDENVTDSLNALDLAGCFFDAETNELSPVTQITRTTTEDKVADVDPHVVYYNEDGKEYMKMYYTKSEYKISDEKEGEVVGDILNPYQVIAVRNYDFENDTWSEDYTGSAKDNILESVGNDGYDEYVENRYGQEFLDLAPSIEIAEELDETGYWAEGTTAKITENELNQSVVKDGDSIAYNHLSLFAYTLDKGGMAQDTGDQNLYLRIYNMHEDTYHHPIQLTSKNAEISDIQFVRVQVPNGEETAEMTYLYWLEDGVVKRINISDLVSNHLIESKTSAGQSFYYVDKAYKDSDDVYEPEQVVAGGYKESEEDDQMSITNFKVRQQGAYTYTDTDAENTTASYSTLELTATAEEAELMSYHVRPPGQVVLHDRTNAV